MKIARCTNPFEKYPEKLIFETFSGTKARLDLANFFDKKDAKLLLKKDHSWIRAAMSELQLFKVDINENEPINLITKIKTMDTRLPYDVVNVVAHIERAYSKGSTNGRNFGLWMNKMGLFDNDKFHLIKKFDKETKPHYRSQDILDNSVLERLHERMDNNQTALFKEGGGIAVANFKTTWRLAIGLGTASVYETGLSLHPVYGFPMIPASSIKGVLRSWIIEEVFGKDESKALQNSKLFCDIFGCDKTGWYKKEMAGKVMFFDAYPRPGFRVEPEVMTPHYGEYYTKDDVPPADWLSPVPIIFLVVSKATFTFRYGWRSWFVHNPPEDDPLWKDFEQRSNTLPSEKPSLKDFLSWWMADALKNHGIGAKTAVGYGRMLKT